MMANKNGQYATPIAILTALRTRVANVTLLCIGMCTMSYVFVRAHMYVYMYVCVHTCIYVHSDTYNEESMAN